MSADETSQNPRTLLLFGSLPLSFDISSLNDLRKHLTEVEDNSWIIDTLLDLPHECEKALSAVRSLNQASGRLACRQLADLCEYFRTGRALDSSFPLSNTLLIPIAVAAQLAQYAEFMSRQSSGESDGWSEALAGMETIGLCTGMLSAFAVSGSQNMEALRQYGAAAIRLGLLIGLVVDGFDAGSARGRYKSISVAWASAEGRERLERVLADFDKAYISVYYDENRATVTLCFDDLSHVLSRLSADGFSASEISLFGRYHSTENLSVAEDLISFCDTHSAFRLPQATSLTIPTRSHDAMGSQLQEGTLHSHAVRAILLEPPQWFSAFSAAYGGSKGSKVLDFGPERSVPPSLSSKIKYSTVAPGTRFEQRSSRNWMDSDVAVVGMSCKVPGANNLDEFWDLLVAGRSQHQDISSGSRFSFDDGPFRAASDPNMKRKWFANLVDAPDQFDHRFFNKSARESASMDPQQRHFLQAAYQAVEQSGYFQSKHGPGDNIGCFVGVCLGDYDNNVASHAANAFTATGNLQGFISGKISHFFGWTGPGLTINTACSSSLVAVHQACQAILSGECEAALAGGSHIMTSAEWFQNLAAGSFLSPTGQCKPFDAKADGYCRGEGVGAVFLKKMSKAIADGDPILGVVAATGVQQNESCTPIFVPNVPSLSDLFVRVLSKARVKPSQISVVEAHGTGTAVGDPAEYDSIRRVLGGPNRGTDNQLMLGSVKGLVGHMECTSGVIGLIKILLMMNREMIPPQASFDKMNPALNAKPSDGIYIPTQKKLWNTEVRAALLNNYGASGSNASAVILQPRNLTGAQSQSLNVKMPAGAKYPFWFSASDKKSLSRYIAAFRKYLSRYESTTSLANIAFNLAYQSNRTLDSSLLLAARSVGELDQALATYEKTDDASTTTKPSSRSVKTPNIILCFGGQVSSHVGFSREIYDSISVFRSHLDHVDAVVQSLGCSSIFPGIFQQSPISDIVGLQTMLFASQYACARSWMDCGVQPVSLLGHSFGELTALCVSQILSLEDAVKMIVRRATLVRDAWGPDKGAMLAIESDLENLKQLIAHVNSTHSHRSVTIACYNGPRSFTLAGSTSAIEAMADQLQGRSNIKMKKLNVTNAFHSVLVDDIYNDLKLAGRGLNFRKPVIPLEFATAESMADSGLTAKYVANHMRDPVYFHHAARRLATRYSASPCIFLEAGSNSTITNMAARALNDLKATLSFHSINVANCEDGWNKLTDSTQSLWKAGLPVQHWAHHGSQRRFHPDVTPLLLPPYQFDPDSRHWMDLRAPPRADTIRDNSLNSGEKKDDNPDQLLAFHGFQDGAAKSQALFRINTHAEKYQQLLSGHVTLQTAPILSATLQIGFVIEAVGTIHPDYQAMQCQPQIRDVDYHSPVCANSGKSTWIEITKDASTLESNSWRFEVFSTDNERTDQARLVHTTGRVIFSTSDDSSLRRELMHFERLFRHSRATDLLRTPQAEEVLGNRNIYRLFSDIVDYGAEFRGMQKMAGHGNETAGHVVRLNKDPKLWFDPHLSDTFCQLGGVWINCMQDHGRGDVYLANRIDQWMRLHPAEQRPNTFDAFAVHHRPSDQQSLTDVFVFDANTGALVEVILGISYVKISRPSMEKLLSRMSSWEAKTHPSKPSNVSPTPPESTQASNSVRSAVEVTALTSQEAPAVVPAAHDTASTAMSKPNSSQNALLDLAMKVKAVIADLSGLEVSEIQDDSILADLGIDSLAGMEMVNEIESTLNVKLPDAEILMVTDLPGLIRCTAGAMGLTTADSSAEPPEEADDSSDRDTTSATTSDDCTTHSSSLAPTSESGGKDEWHGDLGELKLSFSGVMEAFNEMKAGTDERVAKLQQTRYVAEILPLQDDLTIALTLEAFEAMGAGLRDAQPGEQVTRIRHDKSHQRLVTHLYQMLEKETQIIKLDGDAITRTAVPLPDKHSTQLHDELLQRAPDQESATRLLYYSGKNLRSVLLGETDGVKVIFGSSEGRELVSDWYADWPLNRALIAQMEDLVTRLAHVLQNTSDEFKPSESRPLRVLEMGAGTGGTTKRIVPLLARLQVPVEYTFTDLAPSFVAAARKNMGKQYPWMKFRVHDIEKAPEPDLMGTQHLVIASNAIHATKSLAESVKNVRRALRPDGYLLMMEMTRTPYWVDLIFGLFEGWWLFDDGRQHALTHELRWEADLHASGYGHVDWTEGSRPETEIQKLILAAASPDNRCERLINVSQTQHNAQGISLDCAAREQVVANYVRDLTRGFEASMTNAATAVAPDATPRSKCIVITGGTGGLGAHLVAEAALRPDATKVVCLNRPNKRDARERQIEALLKKGIQLPSEALAKLYVLQTDLSHPEKLGLSDQEYNSLLSDTTHIIHNAWLMHSKWPVKRFEPQLRIMANMLHLAGDISARRSQNSLVTFEFISSIATVGHHPLWTRKPVVPEERVPIGSVLPTGYGDAKYICERMLDATLHRFPDRFRATAVRLGQIAGSTTNGHWNPMEHVPFMIKSSQTLGALPDLPGSMGWTPADCMATTLIEILTQPDDVSLYPIYHIENPVRQSWHDVTALLADVLAISGNTLRIIGFGEWIDAVRNWPEREQNNPHGANPAHLLVEFLETNFAPVVRYVIPRARRWLGNLSSSNDVQFTIILFRIGRTAWKAFYAFLIRVSTREQYIYIPLSNGSKSREIRLIQLHPGSGDSPLRADILHISLDSDMAATSRGILLITPSLFHALHRFRMKEEPRILWADAVCINQSDSAEKANQVAMMRDIYASAVRTLVYLGREANGSEIVGNLLLRHIFEEYGLPEPDHPDWKALAKLWGRPWFRRVWVIQEFVLSPDVQMFCGDWEVSWSVFYVITIDAYMTLSFSVVPDIQNGLENAAMHMGMDAMHMMCEYRRLALLGAVSVSDADSMRMLTINMETMVFEEQEEFNLARQADPGLRLRVEVPLLDLLALCDRSEATRARDHLFAVLGLSSAAGDQLFRPDYSASFDEIVRRYGKAFVKKEQCMDLLYQARFNIQSLRFPSWIPDWTTKFVFTGDEIQYRSLGMHGGGLYTAAGDTKCVSWVSDDLKDDGLTVRGRFVDKLSWVGGDHVKYGPIHGLIHRLQQSYDTIRGLEKTSDYYVTGETFDDVWWRTLVANKTKEFRPVPEDFGAGLLSRSNEIHDFYSWLLSMSPEKAKEQLVETIGLPYYKAMYPCYTVYQIARTEKGLLGLVPFLAEAGDEVCIVNGGAVPFALRKRGRLLRGRRLVGECYIHGLMNGEAMRNEYEETDISLY
ncbi:polyketide synthase [Fusarium beomiforme]|uniref:Polyketide synthase n=1 Tax=Fusarium beomiforme TaxID=44412 RepID=A0A9P5DTB2_9HYPO|nr:polyketide synthase [Fusarium beomiforme]